MINLLRNKRKLYVCNVRLENDIKLYDEPIELFENYQVTNTSGSKGGEQDRTHRC